jgi:hypothetical protein
MHFAQDYGNFVVPGGSGDRYSGYAVIGLPFSSGHVLALRRFEKSSVGAAYTSVWHRDPGGRWTFHQNVPPENACARYFGAAIAENSTEPIRIEWKGPRTFRVTVDAPGEIIWDVRLKPTPATRVMNAAARAVPSDSWRKPLLIRSMETAAQWLLGTGEIKLTGRTPNGHRYTATPRLIWSVAESRAVIRGMDAGAPGPLPQQATLGDFRIPQHGIFAITSAILEGDGMDRLTRADDTRSEARFLVPE